MSIAGRCLREPEPFAKRHLRRVTFARNLTTVVNVVRRAPPCPGKRENGGPKLKRDKALSSWRFRFSRKAIERRVVEIFEEVDDFFQRQIVEEALGQRPRRSLCHRGAQFVSLLAASWSRSDAPLESARCLSVITYRPNADCRAMSARAGTSRQTSFAACHVRA